MEIDSDSGQSPQTSSTKETPLSDIALPPAAYPNPNLSAVPFTHANLSKVGETLQFNTHIHKAFFFIRLVFSFTIEVIIWYLTIKTFRYV